MKTMQYHRFLIVLVSLLVAGGRTVPDALADQAGGLPELTAQVQALQNTVALLQAANTTLQNALNTEIAARVAGDNTLQTALTLETSQRSAAVAGLQTTLNTEMTNRISGDQNVQDLITNTQTVVFRSPVGIDIRTNNNFGTIVAVVDLQPSDYLLQAVVSVRNSDSDTQFGGCLLEEIPPGSTITPVPDSNSLIFSGAGDALELEGANGLTVEGMERLTILTQVHVETKAEWGITCVGFGWLTSGGELMAERVAAINP